MSDQIAYCPPIRKGFHLDPRTKIVVMAVLTTLLFYEHEDILFVSATALVPCILLLFNGQRKTVLIYGGLFLLSVVSKLTQDIIVLPQVLNAIAVLLVALVMRLFPTFMLGYYVIYSTKVSEFISAMHKCHIPENFIIPVSVVFRFVPTIVKESKSITYAMKMREISFGTKRFWQNPSAFFEYRVIPLMMSVVKIGEELSAAALTKGLGSDAKRNSIAQIGFGFYDAIMCILMVGMIVWVIV